MVWTGSWALVGKMGLQVLVLSNGGGAGRAEGQNEEYFVVLVRWDIFYLIE